jgi:hypothetical protein
MRNLGIVWGLLIFMALAALAFWFVKDIQNRAALNQVLGREIALRNAALEASGTLKSDFEKAGPYLEFFDKILINPENLLELAGKSKIKSDFTDSSLSVSGTFANIINFLKAVSAGGYLVQFASLDLSLENGSYTAVLETKIHNRPTVAGLKNQVGIATFNVEQALNLGM